MTLPGTAVCITGMHRSGTSAVARALQECGLHLGPQDALLPASVHNREGHWEHDRIVALNDSLLEKLGGSWDRPPKVEPRWDTDASLGSLSARDAIPEEEGIALWRAYTRSILETAPAERSLYVDYDALVADPSREAGRVIAFAGLEPDSVRRARAEASIHVGLRHQPAATVPDGEAARLYEHVLSLARDHGPQPSPPPDQPAKVAALRGLLEEARGRVYSLQDELAARTRERDELWLSQQELKLQTEAQLAEAIGELNRAHRELAAMQQTRLWRLGSGYWRLRGRLLRRRPG
jgi:hypothetical protein